VGVVGEPRVVIFEWICTLATLSGVGLLAKKLYKVGWIVGMCANTAWSVYAGLTTQWGLFALSVLLVCMGTYGLYGVLHPEDEIETHSLEGFDPGPPTIVTVKGKEELKCCQMNAKFIAGIMQMRTDVPMPIGVVDYIEDWGSRKEETVYFRMRYCPFCGEEDHRYKGIRLVDLE
jgi:hypothetical protein